MASPEISVKLVLVSDQLTGKSSIALRFLKGQGSNDNPWPTTTGIFYEEKCIEIQEISVNLCIWDASGRCFWKLPSELELTPSFHKLTFGEASGSMLIYSTSSRATFANVPEWHKRITMYAEEDIPKLLVGHKYCGEEGRVVSYTEGEQMAARIRASFIEVCASSGESVHEAFEVLASFTIPVKKQIHRRDIVNRISNSETLINDLECRNERYSSQFITLSLNIKVICSREKKAKRNTTYLSRKADNLDHQIQRNYHVVQDGVQKVAEARYAAHEAECAQELQRGRMVDMELRVRGIKRRVEELQEQMRRAQGRGTRTGLFWVVGRGEIEAMEEELGRGGWATVSVANFRGLRVAAKCMHRDLVVCDYNRALFSREMSIAATMRHPNLVQFIGATLEGIPIILTELMAASLRAELEKQPLSPDQISSVSLDVARALLYLHLMQPDPIIHRDVSSANVLLNPGPEASWLAKLSDYGSANYVRHVTTRAPGNPSYAAPEADTPTLQSTKMDVFSYGVLLLEMWCCQTPEQGRHGVLLQGLERGEVREMVGRCLQHNPARRPAMADLLLKLQ